MKKNFISWFIALLLTTFMVGCGGGGTSSTTGGTSSTTGSLYFKSLDLNKTVSLAKEFRSSEKTGDSGSLIDSFQVKVPKLELKKSDSTYVTVYSGNEYLETVGTGAGTFAGMLKGTMPDAGTYTGLRLSIEAFKIKAKIVSGGTTYYTTAQTVAQSSIWPLSTTSASYDYITISPVTSTGFTADFPTSLTVTAGNDVNLIWVNESSGLVAFDGDLPNGVTWATNESIVTALLPGVPSKRIQFTLTASPRSNIITLLLDGSGNLLGGYCNRSSIGYTQWAINGDYMKSGSLSAVSNSGNTATFDVSFLDGDSSNYYKITGNYDCGTSTSGTYSSLVVTGVGSTPYYVTDNLTLTTTGSVTCSNIAY